MDEILYRQFYEVTKGQITSHMSSCLYSSDEETYTSNKFLATGAYLLFHNFLDDRARPEDIKFLFSLLDDDNFLTYISAVDHHASRRSAYFYDADLGIE